MTLPLAWAGGRRWRRSRSLRRAADRRRRSAGSSSAPSVTHDRVVVALRSTARAGTRPTAWRLRGRGGRGRRLAVTRVAFDPAATAAARGAADLRRRSPLPLLVGRWARGQGLLQRELADKAARRARDARAATRATRPRRSGRGSPPTSRSAVAGSLQTIVRQAGDAARAELRDGRRAPPRASRSPPSPAPPARRSPTSAACSACCATTASRRGSAAADAAALAVARTPSRATRRPSPRPLACAGARRGSAGGPPARRRRARRRRDSSSRSSGPRRRADGRARSALRCSWRAPAAGRGRARRVLAAVGAPERAARPRLVPARRHPRDGVRDLRDRRLRRAAPGARRARRLIAAGADAARRRLLSRRRRAPRCSAAWRCRGPSGAIVPRQPRAHARGGASKAAEIERSRAREARAAVTARARCASRASCTTRSRTTSA